MDSPIDITIASTCTLVLTYCLQMSLYANWLHEVGKLVYLIGNFSDTAQLKKILDPADPKNRVYFRCLEEFPSNALKKIKLAGVREGILRADWLNKVLERYPEMVVFHFSLGEQAQLDRVELLLRQILRKLNLFTIDVLKANVKEDVVMRVVVTLSKAQTGVPAITEKVNYYLKTYQKDSFVIPYENLGREIAKYRISWLGYLQKNYEKKLRKMQRKLDETVSGEKRLSFVFKIAIISQILGRDEKQRYFDLYNMLKFKFAEVTKRQFNFMRYLQIREIRILADVTVLRMLKHRMVSNTKEIPEFVQGHLNFFKMRSMEPNSCHFYFYYQELIWRSSFLQQALQVLGAADLLELLPGYKVAEWLNGLLSYLHRLASTPLEILDGLTGKEVDLSTEHYLGRYNYSDVTDADMVMTGTKEVLSRRKDYISKGIQLVTRYKSSGLFRDNQTNFLNIYLIRFYIADSRFAAITNIYNEILKVEVNRSNYFLINQLFHEIQSEMHKVDPQSRKLIYGVASLICDYFESGKQLQKFLELFFAQQIVDLVKEIKTTEIKEKSLFAEQLAPEAHIFKLKKNSAIFSVNVLLTQQIILGKEKYKMKLRLGLNPLLRAKLLTGNHILQIRFNHNGMIHEVPLRVQENEGNNVERELEIEPLVHIRKDTMFLIEQVQLLMENRTLVWQLERNQIAFEKYDSALFHINISQPDIGIEDLRKVYFLNETSLIRISVSGISDCKVHAKLSIVEESPQGRTQFFMNKDQKSDLTNSNKQQQLSIDAPTSCWIKCNKLGEKVLKLMLVVTVEKSFDVEWAQKPIRIKATYNITKEVRFDVKSLFAVTKSFREAITGLPCENGIPLNKRVLLCLKITAAEGISVKEVMPHNNPSNKIKYYKNFKMANLKIQANQAIKLNQLFQINEDCAQEIQLFLTTLLIKWTRPGCNIQNVFLDQTTINALQDKISIHFEQKYLIKKRKKGSLFVKIRNLSTEPTNIYATMESTQQLFRVGEKGKWVVLQGYQRCEIEFNVLCIQAGIYEFPPLRVFINSLNEVRVSTANYLVHCE